MTYLIAQNKADVEAASQTISQNMGLGGLDDVTKLWDEPRQVNAPSGEGVDAIQAHPVYSLDPSKVGWWAIQKPAERFMVGVTIEQIGEGEVYFQSKK